MRISTHTSRVGCDTITSELENYAHDFYSHIPCGMWRMNLRYDGESPFISTHTSRVGCDDFEKAFPDDLWISTHTSRVGCDQTLSFAVTVDENFYSHIPCGMWQEHATVVSRATRISTHTHPVWDVTILREEIRNEKLISTHTSRVGCDIKGIKNLPSLLISTHTSRVGCDSGWFHVLFLLLHFYSHIPCGMWLQTDRGMKMLLTFLLTHPVWDVTSFAQITILPSPFLLTHPVWDVTVLLPVLLC